MKVISKFHDYYDVAVWYDSDPKCIFVRKEETFHEKSPVNLSFPLIVNEIVYYCGRFSKMENRNVLIEKQILLFFCGKIYPILSIQTRWNEFEDLTNDRGQTVKRRVDKSNISYCYNTENVFELFSKYGTSNDEKFLNATVGNYFIGERHKRSVTKRHVIERFFRESSKHFTEEETFNLHFVLQSPYFILERVVKHYKEEKCLIVNPQLRKIEFYKVLTPPQALQEIEMFISGIFGGQVPPIVEVSDKIRLEKHGFDVKTSFRKEKE